MLAVSLSPEKTRKVSWQWIFLRFTMTMIFGKSRKFSVLRGTWLQTAENWSKLITSYRSALVIFKFLQHSNRWFDLCNIFTTLGKRACLGEPLARNTYFLFMTSLLKTFEFRPVPDRPLPTLKPKNGLTLGYDGFEAIVTPRTWETRYFSTMTFFKEINQFLLMRRIL